MRAGGKGEVGEGRSGGEGVAGTGTFVAATAYLSHGVYVKSSRVMTKEKIVETVQQLPSDFQLEDLIERLIALQNMEDGLEQVKRGEVVTVEEAKLRVAKWLK